MNTYQLHLNVHPQEWSSYFLLVNKTYLSQSWIYGEAKAKGQGWKIMRCIITENEKPIALTQAWHKKFLFIKLVRISYGPIGINLNPTTQQIKSVFHIIKKQWHLRKLSLLLIAPNLDNSLENNATLKQLRFFKRKSMPYESGFVELTKSVEDLQTQLRQNWRNQLKSAEKKELLFQVSQNNADFEWIMSCIQRLRKEKKFYGHSPELLMALFQNSTKNHEVWISIVSHGENRVAGMLFARHGLSCVPLIIWLSHDGRRLNAGNFLLWNSVLYTKDNGCLWFDLGGTNNSTKFKTGLPHIPYQLIGEYYAFI